MSDASTGYQARAPKAQAYIGKVKVPVQAVSLFHTINQLPYAEFTVALDSNPNDSGLISVGGVQISIAGINQLSKFLQEKFYNSFSLTPDARLVVDDGSGNTITFNGFLVNPVFYVENGRFLMDFTLLHSMIRLQALNASIYSYIPMYGTTQDIYNDSLLGVYNADKSATKGDEVPKRDDSVASRFYLLLNMLQDNYEQLYRDQLDPTRITQLQKDQNAVNPEFEPAMWNIHALNKLLLKDVQNVCTRSKIWTEIQGLSSQGEQNPNFSDAPLHRALFDIMFNSPSIMDALTAMLPMFMFQMNAYWNDTLWLEHSQTLEVPYSMIVTPVGALQFSLSALYEIPLLQVIARGPASDMYSLFPTAGDNPNAPISPVKAEPGALDAEQIRAQTYHLLSRYPSQVPTLEGKAIPGRYMYVDAPYWIGFDVNEILAAQDSVGAIDIKGAGKNAYLSALDSQKTMTRKRLDAGSARMNFLRYIAKYTFKEQYLAKTSARVRIPMMLTPQVGRTYFLRELGQDKSIYIGYLQSVTHTLVLDQGAGTADTELVFSHVISRDASLLPILLGDAEDKENTAITLDQREAKLAALLDSGEPLHAPCEPEKLLSDTSAASTIPDVTRIVPTAAVLTPSAG